MTTTKGITGIHKYSVFSILIDWTTFSLSCHPSEKYRIPSRIFSSSLHLPFNHHQALRSKDFFFLFNNLNIHFLLSILFVIVIVQVQLAYCLDYCNDLLTEQPVFSLLHDDAVRSSIMLSE